MSSVTRAVNLISLEKSWLIWNHGILWPTMFWMIFENYWLKDLKLILMKHIIREMNLFPIVSYFGWENCNYY